MARLSEHAEKGTQRHGARAYGRDGKCFVYNGCQDHNTCPEGRDGVEGRLVELH